MTKNIALFICPIIKLAGRKFAFVDKWKKEKMENSFVKLPAIKNGTPDWTYMESYMKQVVDESEKKIDYLSVLSKSNL